MHLCSLAMAAVGREEAVSYRTQGSSLHHHRGVPQAVRLLSTLLFVASFCKMRSQQS